MRTLKSIFTALFVVTFMSFSFANDSNTSISTENAMFVEARSTAKNTVDLRLVNVQANKLTIRLKDVAGEVLYFEKLKNQSAYFKQFVLSELPDGNYLFSISPNNLQEVVKTFSIKEGTVQISAIKEIFTANTAKSCTAKVISVGEHAANLHLVNNTSKKVTMRLKDAAGQVWYFEKIDAQDTLQKRFILSHLPDGKYSFSIDGANETFKQVLYMKNGVAELQKDMPRA